MSIEWMVEENLYDNNSEHASTDSEDRDLQEKFSQEDVKGGSLYEQLVLDHTTTTRNSNYSKSINNISELKQCFINMRNYYPEDWIERLAINVQVPSNLVSDATREKNSINVNDDINREFIFYQQAQRGVSDALKMLCNTNYEIERPDDYFAEMIKPELHMQKVRENIVKLEKREEHRVKSKKDRENRKKIKLEKKLNAKKSFNSSISNGFQENKETGMGKQNEIRCSSLTRRLIRDKFNQKKNKKRKWKDTKFGFGGKETKRLKKSNNGDDYPPSQSGPRSFQSVRKMNKKQKLIIRKDKNKKQRPGKIRRQQIKSKRNTILN